MELRAQETETASFMSVAGQNRGVVGAIELRDLILARPDALVEDLMHDPMLITATDPEESAARRVVDANVIATAVVDSDHLLSHRESCAQH
ncbi:MAG: hypothetical protein ABIW32_06220 [Terrimesophilobacter sp.]